MKIKRCIRIVEEYLRYTPLRTIVLSSRWRRRSGSVNLMHIWIFEGMHEGESGGLCQTGTNMKAVNLLNNYNLLGHENTELDGWRKTLSPPYPDPDHEKAHHLKPEDSRIRSWRRQAKMIRRLGAYHSISAVFQFTTRNPFLYALLRKYNHEVRITRSRQIYLLDS